MPIIIDAWNFIRNDLSPISDDGRDALEAAADLHHYFEQYQRTHGDPVILVFDSAREHLGFAHSNNDKLKVVAARSADTYIKKYIDAVPERQRRNLRVVSSDNDVYHHAKSSYATPIRSDEFWGMLTGSKKKTHGSRKKRRSDYV
jgi:predicted RNA-binding protein with PIN domain